MKRHATAASASFPGDGLFDAEEDAFRHEFRTWLERHPAPERPPTTDSAWMDEYGRWQASMAESGYAALHWPTEFGGAARPVAQQLVQIEEFTATGTDPKVLMAGLYLVGPLLMALGTPEQQRRHLGEILFGRERWCVLLSEPDAGSDLLSVKSGALVEDGQLRITGQKVWTSYGHVAHYGILLVRTDPDSTGSRGLSLVIVDMTSPGVVVRPIRQMNGESEFNEVFLDDVIVPLENVVGDLHGGTKSLMVLLSAERTGLSMAGYAMLVAKIEELRGAARDTQDRELRAEYVRLWSRTALQRLTALRSVSNLSDPESSFASASAAKLQSAANSKALADLALRFVGLNGIAQDAQDRDHAVIARQFVRSPADSIGGGTSEVQKNTIAERVLGLPR